MDPADIEELAPLYDRAFNSWDIDSHDVKESKQLFGKLLQQHYETDCPNKQPNFIDYRREVLRKCKAWLQKGN